jgi:hypothetical protein
MRDDDPRTLTATVMAYTETVARLVPVARSASDWDPLAAFVALEGFERVGTFLEVQNWTQYTEMLTGWASSIDSFETTVHRIGELPPVVYFEVEERHRRGDALTSVNSLTVFDFDEAGKIRRLEVFLQQTRA